MRRIIEFTLEALAIKVDRRLADIDVIEVLASLFEARGVLGHIRSDQGPQGSSQSGAAVVRCPPCTNGIHPKGLSREKRLQSGSS